MAKGKSKKSIIIAIIILVVLLAIAGVFALWQNNQKAVVETPAPTTSTQPSTDTTDTTDTQETTVPESETPTTPDVDPATLSSIDIEPLKITVAYTRGIPGFEFNVLRTADQTQYVVFSSPDLVGTKCTDDTGAIVSIIKNPATNDGTTVSQKKTIGSDTYGLSLASDTCTSDTDLLTEYQTAFTNGFSQLKEME